MIARDIVPIGPPSDPVATLYRGDAYAIRPTLGWFDADVMDPPYKFDNSGGGAFRKSRIGANRIVAEALDQGFDPAIVNPLLCGAVAVFCHNDQLPGLLPRLDGLFHRFAVLFWTKPNPSPMANRHYLADTELWIHAWSRRFPPQGAHHDRHRFHSASSTATAVWDHPTVKPLSLMDKIVVNMCGRSICDPFMGTGSTGVAALRQGKHFAGIEHNPKHFATAVTRIEAAWAELERASSSPSTCDGEGDHAQHGGGVAA